MGEYGILERMKISPQAWEVFSELLVNFAAVILLAILGYFIAQDWFRLTTCIILCILITRIAIQFRRLSLQYLLALRDADCAEQPIGWLGIIPPDFDGSSPSEVMVEGFGRDAMERTQPFLKAAVIAVDVVDVEVGCLRPRPTGGR